MFDNIRNIQYDIDLSGRPVDAKNIFMGNDSVNITENILKLINDELK